MRRVSDNRRHVAYLCTHSLLSFVEDRSIRDAGFGPKSSMWAAPICPEDAQTDLAAIAQ